MKKSKKPRKCRLCGDRDEMINNTFRKCSKLAQRENKTRQDWMGKVIHMELCKKLKLDHRNKRYTHNLENETLKILWDFEIQMDHLILTRQPDLEIAYRKVNFAIPADHRVKLKESKTRDRYLDLARELKKLWNIKVTVITIVIGALGTVTKGLVQGMEDLEIRRRVETIQPTALLSSARILRRVLETWGDLLLLRLQWETTGESWCKKLSNK